MTTEHALLGFLRLRPMHGYELYRRLSDPEGLGLVWKMKQSHLYALLAKLEAERLIVAELQPQPNRPPRKVFRLTRTGGQAYRTWVRSPVSRPRSMRQEFLVKLYFASLEGESTARALVERQKETWREWLRSQDEPPGEPGEMQSFPAFVRSFRLGQLEAMLGWLDLCQQTPPAIQPRT
jgi:PadR family transcriptional regulator AphA